MIVNRCMAAWLIQRNNNSLVKDVMYEVVILVVSAVPAVHEYSMHYNMSNGHATKVEPFVTRIALHHVIVIRFRECTHTHYNLIVICLTSWYTFIADFWKSWLRPFPKNIKSGRESTKKRGNKQAGESHIRQSDNVIHMYNNDCTCSWCCDGLTSACLCPRFLVLSLDNSSTLQFFLNLSVLLSFKIISSYQSSPAIRLLFPLCSSYNTPKNFWPKQNMPRGITWVLEGHVSFHTLCLQVFSLSQVSIGKLSIGHIINLTTNDVQRLEYVRI